MTILGQFLRYGVVGVASNVILYLLYLALTHSGLGYKTAATLCYGVGALQTFIFNKRWSFRHKRGYAGPVGRYIAVYLFGYLLNLFALLVMVDWAGYPHQAVQAAMVLGIALLVFALSRYWVFVERVRQPGLT